jgi:hypothetical protein
MIYLIVSVRFHAIGSAPILKQRVFKISASSRFSVVLNFLRKKVGVREGDGLFCYVNSVFAPGLDEGVGNLYRVRILSVWVAAASINIRRILVSTCFVVPANQEQEQGKGAKEQGTLENVWSANTRLI